MTVLLAASPTFHKRVAFLFTFHALFCLQGWLDKSDFCRGCWPLLSIDCRPQILRANKNSLALSGLACTTATLHTHSAPDKMFSALVPLIAF